LGHSIDQNGTQLTEDRKQQIMAFSPPSTIRLLRSFLGMTQFFNHFSADYADFVAPLYALEKTKPFKWTPEANQAFEELKKHIAASGALCRLDYNLPIELFMDTSDHTCCGTLVNISKSGEILPISHYSHVYSDTARRWTIMEKEGFSVYSTVKHFAPLIFQVYTIWRTDHRNLLWMQSSTSPKVIRWRLFLEQFPHTLLHDPGKGPKIRIPDWFTRAVRRIEAVSFQGEISDMELDLLLDRFHNPIVGHGGVHRTFDLLRQAGYQWKAMRDDIREYIKRCDACQKLRLGREQLSRALGSILTLESGEVLAIDFIGPLPPDAEGNRFIHTSLDEFNCIATLGKCKSTSAEDAAQQLVHVSGRFGLPRIIHSDKGAAYTSKVWSQLLKAFSAGQNYETGPRFTPAYHPQANPAERTNQEVMRHLRAIFFDRRVMENWSNSLPLVERIINSSFNRRIGMSPFRMLYGDTMTLNRALIDVFHERREVDNPEVYIQQFTSTLDNIISASREHQSEVLEEYLSKTPDQPDSFSIGDFVAISYPERPPHKLAPRWRGPMIVTAVHNNIYDCIDIISQNILKIDFDRLKLYRVERCEPLWVAAVDKEEYVVDSIVDHTGDPRRKSTLFFRVHWAGYEPEEDSWLPLNRVKDLAALTIYLAAHPELGMA
jgi:hypothetical protein